MVSHDAIRRELGAEPTGAQGAVIALARDRAKSYLRAGADFAWNATNLTRAIRAPLLELFDDYRARIEIVHLETSADELWRRNRQRSAHVPEAAISHLLDRWEPPRPDRSPHRPPSRHLT